MLLTVIIVQRGGYPADMTTVGIGIDMAPPPLQLKQRSSYFRKPSVAVGILPSFGGSNSSRYQNITATSAQLLAGVGGAGLPVSFEGGWPNVTESWEDDDHLYGLLPPFRQFNKMCITITAPTPTATNAMEKKASSCNAGNGAQDGAQRRQRTPPPRGVRPRLGSCSKANLMQQFTAIQIQVPTSVPTTLQMKDEKGRRKTEKNFLLHIRVPTLDGGGGSDTSSCYHACIASQPRPASYGKEQLLAVAACNPKDVRQHFYFRMHAFQSNAPAAPHAWVEIRQAPPLLQLQTASSTVAAASVAPPARADPASDIGGGTKYYNNNNDNNNNNSSERMHQHMAYDQPGQEPERCVAADTHSGAIILKDCAVHRPEESPAAPSTSSPAPPSSCMLERLWKVTNTLIIPDIGDIIGDRDTGSNSKDDRRDTKMTHNAGHAFAHPSEGAGGVRVDVRKRRRNAKRPRLLCWIQTFKETVQYRATAVRDTWGKSCDVLLFATNSNHTGFEVLLVTLPNGNVESRKYLWDKAKQAWLHVRNASF